jgi:hypothetical protein
MKTFKNICESFKTYVRVLKHMAVFKEEFPLISFDLEMNGVGF